ncbi:hypothetical protein Celaphus_00009927, partial [Cervus elaphus hippelaphus]
ASPPPCGGPGGPGGGPGDALGTAATGVGAAGVVVGVGGAVGVGGCCSGPGHSKRRRQAPGVGAVGGGSPEREEVGAGYNSEDEYEAAAARIEAMDPATVEQQEHWFEKALRDKKGFIIKQMKEDGACLFRAVADQVYGDQDMHEVVRKHCMDYLMKNADYFSNYVTEDFTTYINRKRKNNCHGNHIEMQAMAEMYNRPVEVYQYSTGTSVVEPINTFHGIHQNEDEPIRVSYHRNIHYNSVVNPNKATIGVGLGLPSFKPGPRKASATCSSATAAASSGLEEWTSRSPRQRSSASSPEHPELHAELGIKPPSPGTVLALAKPPSPCAPGTSSQFSTGADRATSPLVSLYPALECRALIQQMSPSAFGSRGQLGVGERWKKQLVLKRGLLEPLDISSGKESFSGPRVCPRGDLSLNDWDDDEILASVLAVSQQEYLDSMKKNKVHRDPPPDKS